MSQITTTASAAAETDAAQFTAELDILIQDFERNTAARPPSDSALARWEERVAALSDRANKASFSGKPRLQRHIERFRSELADVRDRKLRFLAARQRRREMSRVDDLAWDGAFEPQPRQALAAAIHEQIEIRLCLSADEEMPSVAEAPPRVDPAPKSDEQVPPAVVKPVAAPLPVAFSRAASAPASASATAVDAPQASAPEQSRTEREDGAAYRRHSTRLDPIMAIEGRLARPGTFDEAREIALDWLRKKGFKVPLGDAASFELDGPKVGYRATAVGLQKVWALQAETTDRGLQGRRWRVEMVLVDAAPTPAVAVTLTAITPAGGPPPEPSIPGLVSDLIEKIGMLDTEAGEVLNAGPTYVGDEVSLKRLVASLLLETRSRPAIVISTYRKADRLATLLDPEGLASRLGGLAKVYQLSREMTWAFTEALNKRFAVAGASVRMFKPDFTVDDERGRHPSWSPTELTAHGLNLYGLSALFLREAAFISLRALEREDAIPSFERVREQVLRRQIEDARRRVSEAAAMPQHAVNITDLQKAVSDSQQLQEMFEAENDQLRGELQRARDEQEELKARIFRLESRLQVSEARLLEQQVDATPEFPDTWDELEDWCDAHLGDGVVVTKKAIRVACDSVFLDIPFAYEVLWFLADTYAPSRQGLLHDGGERLNTEMQRLGIEISGAGRAAVQRRSKDTYSVDYKRGRVPLDMHVKGNSKRDPRFAFRVYFHWHEQDQCVVVGSFPEHLDNALT